MRSWTCWLCWGVTSVTLRDLSWRNARRQARDYLVYFVTIVIATALMYAFNGLVFSREIAELSAKLSSLPLVIVLASVAVVLILGWLVAYITRFMLTRRSRELGTYLLIGLEHRQVARLFFLENLAVGAVALVLGVVLGNLMFQILRAIMLALFGVEYRLSFAFSLEAVGMTLLYVLLVYLLALGRSRRRIRRMQIHDFMELDRQNENVVIRTSRRRRRVFVLSLLLGAVGTVLLLAGGLLFGLVGAGCIIAFLYGFFLSFASGVPAFFEKHPGRKYRGQTLVIFRTLTAKLATMGVVMATILTVQQLSETDRYRRQFELLRKLGMDGTEMGRALRRQFALYYAMPVLPAGIIGVAFVRNLGGAVEPGTLTGLYSPGMITAAALGLFFLLYGIYILMAYTSLKRTVLPEP